MLTALRILSIAGALAMAGAIIWAFATGDFFDEGSQIWGLPWGKVSLIDIYVGLAFFGAWIAYREGSWPRTALWWLALVVLGNLTAAIYLARAAFTSTTPRQVLLGDRETRSQ